MLKRESQEKEVDKYLVKCSYGRMRKLILGFLLIMLLLLSKKNAYGFDLIKLDEATIGYRQFSEEGRDLLIQESGLANRRADKKVSLGLNVDILEAFYFDNVVHGTTDTPVVGEGSGQFRTVGWNYKLGLRVTSFLKVEYEHHSQHMLDWQRPGQFPVEDSIGFQLQLYKSPKGREPLF